MSRFLYIKYKHKSFRNVCDSMDYGFFDGKRKDTDRSIIFASVATLGRPILKAS